MIFSISFLIEIVDWVFNRKTKCNICCYYGSYAYRGSLKLLRGNILLRFLIIKKRSLCNIWFPNVQLNASSLYLQFTHGTMVLQWRNLTAGEMEKKDVQRSLRDVNN